jgi:hypothetical protein
LLLTVPNDQVPYEIFELLAKRALDLTRRISYLRQRIPDSSEFWTTLEEIFEDCKGSDVHAPSGRGGNAVGSSSIWAVAVEMTDGSTWAKGDIEETFSFGECANLMNYCFAVEDVGVDKVFGCIALLCVTVFGGDGIRWRGIQWQDFRLDVVV